MKQLHTFFSLLVLSCGFSLFSSCKKAEPPLPDAVVGGDNVFACHINGKSFIAHDHADLFGSSSKAVFGGFWEVYEPYQRTNNFWLTGSTTDGDMELYISFCDTTGVYTLNSDINCPNPTCTPLKDYAVYQHKLFTGSVSQGYINMQLINRSADEVKGEFAFKAKDKQGNEINVTDGRFYSKHRN